LFGAFVCRVTKPGFVMLSTHTIRTVGIFVVEATKQHYNEDQDPINARLACSPLLRL